MPVVPVQLVGSMRIFCDYHEILSVVIVTSFKGGKNMNDKCQMITEYQSQISTITAEIRTLEDEIQELMTLKSKMQNLSHNLDAISSFVSTVVRSLPGKMEHSIKLNLFSDLLNHAKGAQYTKAVADLEAGTQKIQKKIDEMRNKINTLRKQSNQYSILIEQEKNQGG